MPLVQEPLPILAIEILYGPIRDPVVRPAVELYSVSISPYVVNMAVVAMAINCSDLSTGGK